MLAVMSPTAITIVCVIGALVAAALIWLLLNR